MTTIALYGHCEKTRNLIHGSNADEIWSVNMAWDRGCPRIDRLFDLHERWHLTHPGDAMEAHWAWLQEPHDFPIYMLEDVSTCESKLKEAERELSEYDPADEEERDDENRLEWLENKVESARLDIDFYKSIPAVVRYPIEEVIEQMPRKYITSSFGYMMGYALTMPDISRIEIYGFDMGVGGSVTEYAYQKAGAEYLIGYAEGLGIDVYLPSKSLLCNSPLYGYEGGFQVIGRQTMEKIRNDYKRDFDVFYADFLKAVGRYHQKRQDTLVETDPDRRKVLEDESRALHKARVAAQEKVIMQDAAVQVADHFIEHIDVDEADTTIRNRIVVKEK